MPSLIEAMEHSKLWYKKSAVMTLGKLCEDLNPLLIKKEDSKRLFLGLLEEVSSKEVSSLAVKALVGAIPFASISLSDD